MFLPSPSSGSSVTGSSLTGSELSASPRSGVLSRIVLSLLLLTLCFSAAAQDIPLVRALQLRSLEQEAMLSTGRFSRFGNYFAVISRDNRVRMYDGDFSLLWSYRGRGDHGTAPAVAISGDERWTLFPGYGSPSALALVESTNGELVQRSTQHKNEVLALTISPDGEYAVSFAEGELFLWRIGSAGLELVHEINPGELRVTALSISPDSRLLALGNSDDYISLYAIDGENHRLLPAGELRPTQYYSNTGYLDGLQFSPDGRWLAVGVRKELTIYRIENREAELWQVIPDIEEGNIYSLTFAPDSKTLFTGFGGSVISVWRLGDDGGSAVRPDARELGAAGAAAESLARGDFPQLWSYESTFSAGQGYIADLAVHPDGSRLATISITENGLVFWRLEEVGAGPVSLASALLKSINGGVNPGPAQIAVLDEAFAVELLESLGTDATAPRDMFESADQYERRLEAAARRADELIIQEVVRQFEASQEGDEIRFPVEEQGRYEIDDELYFIRAAGAPARLSISPANARDLFLSWQDASAVATREGQWYSWSLRHPVSGRSYPLLFEADPLSGRISSEHRANIPPMEIARQILLTDIDAPELFPSLYRSYRNIPLLEARLQNLRDLPMENISIRSRIGENGERLVVVHSEDLPAGQSLNLAAGAFLSRSILDPDGGDIVPLILDVTFTFAGVRENEEIRVPLRRMNTNAIRWDDDRKAAAMITSIQSPAVMETSGTVLASLAGLERRGLPANFATALGLFQALVSSDISYRIDPATPYERVSADRGAIDFLQFPAETLLYGSGDCDDLSVLYASLLEASGIPSALITVPGHIFPAFDSGIEVRQAGEYFPDRSRLIERDGRIWIPVESTLLDADFTQAWISAAQLWRRHAGAGEAQMYITSDAWQTYPPADFDDPAEVSGLRSGQISPLSRQLGQLRSVHSAALIDAGGLTGADSPREYNRRGIIRARFGFYEDAEDDFLSALADGEYGPALINLAKLALIRGDKQTAEDYFARAEAQQPENPYLLLSKALLLIENGNVAAARESYDRAVELDARIAQSHRLFEENDGDGNRADAADSAFTELRFTAWAP